jgi:NAD(P)-dependent dehydrogenase (short-subunit alcohol dehydrogenase family)
MRLNNKVALVTGAGGPMGAAIALRMAQEGAALVITDISGTRVAETAARIEAIDGRNAGLLVHRGNILVREEVQALCDRALAQFGRIDVLVNVVGGIASKVLYQPFLEISEERWAGTYDINLSGTRHLVRATAPGMVERGYGRIVNVASTDFAGQWGHADYASSKAAVVSLTRVLAMELAPHVAVNCIAPGLISTRAVDVIPDAKIAERIGHTLLKRIGRPEEIADAALFLGSDESSYITGETLRVSGGLPAAL